MLAYAPQAQRLERTVRVATGGAPPSPAILRRMGELGFDVTHLYGLTETFGPAMICDWRPEWDELDADARARIKARQGVGNVIACTARVIAADGTDVPADGQTVGQIALRGNNVMLGYLNDPEATREAAPDGWFRTGDLGVLHPDGYVELKDRSKDVIVSGGENIASVEVEQAIADHPAVLEVAVIAVPDERWGEVPAAYVTLQDGASADRGRHHRARPRPAGPVQGAEVGHLRPAAEDVNRQDPEVRAAGRGLGRLRPADQLTSAGAGNDGAGDPTAPLVPGRAGRRARAPGDHGRRRVDPPALLGRPRTGRGWCSCTAAPPTPAGGTMSRRSSPAATGSSRSTCPDTATAAAARSTGWTAGRTRSSRPPRPAGSRRGRWWSGTAWAAGSP